MKIIRKFAMAISVFLLISTGLRAQVPQMINYQGRVVVGTVNFDGSGGFRFALVNGNGSTTYWSNDGTSTAGSAPTGAVTLAVSKGLYTVLLGDTTLPNMTAVPASVFTPPDVRLRVWFNDGVHGTQLLAPDQRIAAVGYAMMAGGVTDGAITAPKLAAGSVTADKLAAGVGTGNLPWQPVTGTAQQAQPNSGYLVGAGTLSTVTLPTAAAIGDVVRVSGTGVGGWKVAQNAGQTIRGINGNQFGISGISGISYPGSLSSVGFTTSQNLGNVNFAAVACSSDGNKIVAVGSYNFIYTSADAGSTWVTRETSRYWTAVCSSPDGTKLAATVGGGFIYTSTDSGVTWTARLTDAARSWVAIASTSGGQYLLAADSNLLYESNDYGVTWTAESQTANQWTAVAYAKTATTQTLVAGWDAGLFVSHDFTTFTSIPNINTWGAASLAISADGTVVYLARKSYTGYLFRSTDSGTTFSSLASSPFDNFVSVACSPDGTHVVAASFQPNSKIYTSADSGATWVTPSPTTAGGPWGYVRSSLAISADGTKLVAVGTGFVLTSADSGATWI